MERAGEKKGNERREKERKGLEGKGLFYCCRSKTETQLQNTGDVYVEATAQPSLFQTVLRRLDSRNGLWREALEIYSPLQ